MGGGPMTRVHAAWLPVEAFRPLGSRHTVVYGHGLLVTTVLDEVATACTRHGGTVRHGGSTWDGSTDGRADLVLALTGATALRDEDPTAAGSGDPEGFGLARHDGVTVLVADGAGRAAVRPVPPGPARRGGVRRRTGRRSITARRCAAACSTTGTTWTCTRSWARSSGGTRAVRCSGGTARRAGTGAGTRVRAAAGGRRVQRGRGQQRQRARHRGAPADRPARRGRRDRGHPAPVRDPGVPVGQLRRTDDRRRAGHRRSAGRDGAGLVGRATREVYRAIPDFGGYLVKADSEGQPGPFGYGRSHADGANLLADALAPFGGTVHWRAFVYNHRQDWRDRSTDRARAAYDHFAPLDGQFRDNVILQVKYGPIDFQVREPVSPVDRGHAAHPGGRGVPGDPGVHRPAAARVLSRPAVERGAPVPAVGHRRGPVWRRPRRGRRPGRGRQCGRRPVLDRPPAGAGQPVRVRPARLGTRRRPAVHSRRVDRADLHAGRHSRPRPAAARAARRCSTNRG